MLLSDVEQNQCSSKQLVCKLINGRVHQNLTIFFEIGDFMKYYVLPQCYKDFNTNDFLKSTNSLKVKFAILCNTTEDVIVKLSDEEYQEALEILDVPSLKEADSKSINKLRNEVLEQFSELDDEDVSNIASELSRMIGLTWQTESITNILVEFLAHLRTHETHLEQYLVTVKDYELLSLWLSVDFYVGDAFYDWFNDDDDLMTYD